MSPPRQFDDGVLDAILFSMGRTMTQEEVRQLMQRTVQQVRLFGLSCFISVWQRTDLRWFWCSSVAPQVSGTLSLDLDRAEHLLVHCKWNVDLLVQRYTDDPDGLNMAAGLKFRNPQPPQSPTSSCPVCLSPRSTASEPVPSLSCMHYCCRVRPRSVSGVAGGGLRVDANVWLCLYCSRAGRNT